MEVKVVFLEHLDVSKLTLSQLRNNPVGQTRTAHLLYDGDPFCLSYLDALFPFGATSKRTEMVDKIGNKYEKEFWSLLCSLEPHVLEKFEAIDNQILKLVLESNIPEFTKFGDKTTINGYYNKLVKTGLPKTTGEGVDEVSTLSTIKVNLQTEPSGGFQCSFYHSDPIKPKLELTNHYTNSNYIKQHLTPDSKGSILFGMRLWVNANGFGLNLKAEEIRIDKVGKPEVCCLLD